MVISLFRFSSIERDLADETQTLACARQLAQACRQPCFIFLQGELGVGKTTWARGFLRGLGYEGQVKSPTYTLVEPYQFAEQTLYHFDLYRLADAVELENIGIRDYFAKPAYGLVEWPERGRDVLPEPDLWIQLTIQGPGRKIRVQAHSDTGEKILVEFLKQSVEKI